MWSAFSRRARERYSTEEETGLVGGSSTGVEKQHRRVEGGRGGNGIMAMAPTRRAVAPADRAQNRCELSEVAGMMVGRFMGWVGLVSTGVEGPRRWLQAGAGRW